MVCSMAIENCYIKLVATWGNWSSTLWGALEDSVGHAAESCSIYSPTLHPSQFESCFQGHELASTSGLSCTQVTPVPMVRTLYIVPLNRMQGGLAWALTEPPQCFLFVVFFSKETSFLFNQPVTVCCLHPETLPVECISPFQSFLAPS